MIVFLEDRFLIHSIPFTVLAMPPACRENQRSEHRQAKKVASFSINTEGSLENINLDADAFRPAKLQNYQLTFSQDLDDKE